jgi:hypothetical protein
MNQLRGEGSHEATDELWSLANGPDVTIKLYSGAICNGVRFHTKERDNRRKSQNSGVVVEGEHNNKTINFYGYLNKVWEMSYIFGHSIFLFQCEWFNLGSGKTVQTDAHFTSINVKSKWYQNDPFVLPDQVKQVFYVNDTKLGRDWQVVQHIHHRGLWDVPELEDVEVSENELHVPSDAFQQDESTEVAGVVVEDNEIGQLHRTDLDPEIIPRDRIFQWGSREGNNIDLLFSHSLSDYCFILVNRIYGLEAADSFDGVS